MWYHGDIEKRSTFIGQRMDRQRGSRDPNAQGPGIYWTTDKQQAIGYAGPNGWVYTAEIVGNFLTEFDKPIRRKILSLIRNAPKAAYETGLSNWGYDGTTSEKLALGLALDQYVREEKFLDAAVAIYHDFYGWNAEAWTEAMVKIGYDGVVIDFSNEKHLAVYNPSIIKVIDEEVNR